LNKLHFPMEAFGNAIVFAKLPHSRNLAPPTVKGLCQRLPFGAEGIAVLEF